MIKIGMYELVEAMKNSGFIWILVPIFFVGVVTDKYQEEMKTSVGNAISNGALIIFTGFSWLEVIYERTNFPIEATVSQTVLSLFVITYGFAIIASGFRSAKFAQKYGRIRVVTFMLMFFTMIIHVTVLYNFVSILLFVLLFPFYYAFITELIKVMPNAKGKIKEDIKSVKYNHLPIHEKFMYIGKMKLKEYLK